MVFKLAHCNGSLKYCYCPIYVYTEEVAFTQEGQGRVLPGPVSNEPLFKASSRDIIGLKHYMCVGRVQIADQPKGESRQGSVTESCSCPAGHWQCDLG